MLTAEQRVGPGAPRAGTTASMLVQAGVPVRTAQEILRHVDPRTTMRVYAHVQAADRLDAVARLAAHAASGAAEQAVVGG